MEKLFTIEGEDDFQIGLDLLNSSIQWNHRKALQAFCRAAEKGHTEAIFQVGLMYLIGGPQIDRNVEKAVECLKISAERDLAIAKYGLAQCYLYGVGVDKDEKKAIILFEESFKQGCFNAADSLSDIYRYGIGIPSDLQKAKEYNLYARQAQIPNADFKFIGLLTGI